MRTFILGLGAQKAGTTWLFQQLVKSEHFVPGLCKEYHLFDYLYLGSGNELRLNASKRINNFKEGDPTLNYDQKIELFDSFYSNPKNYYDYIDRILNESKKFTSDITPAYAHLELDVLYSIKEEMDCRNIKTKAVFLMREPVCRMESEIRMALRRAKSFDKVDAREMSNKMTRLLGGEIPLKSNYSFTVSQLDEVFPPSDIFYCFYEELFLPESIRRLAEFFELPTTIFEPDVKINTSPRPFRYPMEHLERWSKHFEGEYQFAQSRFNFDVEIWQSALHHNLSLEKRRKWFWI